MIAIQVFITKSLHFGMAYLNSYLGIAGFVEWTITLLTHFTTKRSQNTYKNKCSYRSFRQHFISKDKFKVISIIVYFLNTFSWDKNYKIL